MQKKWVLAETVFILALLPAIWVAAVQAEEPPSPKAFFTESSWNFDPVLEGQEVIHDFAVKNQGDAPLEILKVKTS